MISGGYRCPLYDDDAAATTTDLGSDQATHQLDSAYTAVPFASKQITSRRRWPHGWPSCAWSPLVELLGRAVRDGDWAAIHAIGDYLSVEVQVAA